MQIEQMFRTYEWLYNGEDDKNMNKCQGIYEMNDRELRRYRRELRMRRERRKKRFTLACVILSAFCIMLICALSYGAIKSKANSGFKYYTSVTVGTGETLWELADNYIDYNYYKNKSSYISEVQSINHLEEKDNITAGQVLILPYYSSEFVY